MSSTNNLAENMSVYSAPTNNLYHLPTSSTGQEVVGYHIFDDPGFDQKLKQIVETQVAELFFRYAYSSGLSDDGPFDPIYIVDLKPDLVQKCVVELFTALSEIEDRSDSIFFDDEWDD